MSPTPRIDSPATKALVGKNMVIKGQILSRENLTIEGEVEGTIEMVEHRLTIAADGNVKADVNVLEVDLSGSMHGRIEARDKVYIRKGAKFVGDIHSVGIVIEDGGYIKGGVDLSRQPAGSVGPGAGSGRDSDAAFKPNGSGQLKERVDSSLTS